MKRRLYVLDTSVLLALVRGKALGELIERTYELSAQPLRPLACSVSHGELWSIAEANGWDNARRGALANMLAQTVLVDPSTPGVVEAYVALYMVCRKHPQGSRTNMGDNDLWIAATARASGATLLTSDRDFDHFTPADVEFIYIDPSSVRLQSGPLE